MLRRLVLACVILTAGSACASVQPYKVRSMATPFPQKDAVQTEVQPDGEVYAIPIYNRWHFRKVVFYYLPTEDARVSGRMLTRGALLTAVMVCDNPKEPDLVTDGAIFDEEKHARWLAKWRKKFLQVIEESYTIKYFVHDFTGPSSLGPPGFSLG